MKFDVDDKNRCRLVCVCVCVKFHLNRCRFAVAVAKCLGGSLFLGHSVHTYIHSAKNREDKSEVLVTAGLAKSNGSLPLGLRT